MSQNKAEPMERIYALARRVAAGELETAQLPQAIQASALAGIPAKVWTEIEAQINHAPRLAQALALVVKELAFQSSDLRLRAAAQLAFVRALNALGEFREAVRQCPDAIQVFLALKDNASVARTWLEAAWAETYLGNLARAREHLTRARALIELAGDARLQARANWIEGRILRDQGEYVQASRLFEHAREAFQSAGENLDVARCQRELGLCTLSTDPAQALPLLETARDSFIKANCPGEAAYCENYLGQVYRTLNRYPEARTYFTSARQTFTEHGMHFYVAYCDLDQGFLEWYLNHFDAALVLLQKARDYFLGAGAESEASSCDINIGVILIELNRYEEANPRLQRAAEQALASNRRGKAGVCFMNLGWVADQQGRYAQALNYYQRARTEFTQGKSLSRIAWCERNLGRTYFNLGQYDEALHSLEQARQICIAQEMSSDLAECELYRGQVLLTLAKTAEAVESLLHARTLFDAAKQEVYTALCDRVLASVERQDKKAALARLEQSREVFVKHGQPIDVALCDLTCGELHLAWREWSKAREYVHRARRPLHPGFPDQAWRTDYALGQIALAQKKKQIALNHYLEAVQTIAHLRADLGLERLSNDVFGARRQVLRDALRLAQTARSATKGLSVIEAAKAQIFLSYLTRRDWREPADLLTEADGVVLSQRERELRYQLAALRRQVSLQAAQAQGEPVRGEDPQEMVSAEKLKELRAVSETYESVVARLRLTRHGLAGVPTLDPFSVNTFRKMAQARWGEAWAALDYYLDGDLTIAYVDSQTVELESVPLSNYDRFVLEQCTGTHPDLRELMYRGTVRGSPAPASSTRYLQYLTTKLVPERLRNSQDQLTVVIAPHGLLHQLPFHTLRAGDAYLLDRFAFVYTPSLQALTQLWQEADARVSGRLLLCGLDEFGDRARSLPYAKRELDALEAWIQPGDPVLWKSDSMRQKLLDWSQSGKLRDFGTLHFATHAITEVRAPHASRILLDDDLTVLDIMDLNLNARLVTLSACSTALGEGGPGDEFVSLAHAFFYAGARALVASLWAVEDESTAQLMACFYRQLENGQAITQALRQAQLDMKNAGLQPFHWAPFVAIGNA